MPVALPSKHAKSRNAETGQRGTDEIRNRPEIFGDDFGAGPAEDLQHAFAEHDLLAFVSRREKRTASIARPAVRPVEADQAIDAVAVEEIRASARSLAKPPEVFPCDHIPAIRRHAPVLPVGAERVGRRAE